MRLRVITSRASVKAAGATLAKQIVLGVPVKTRLGHQGDSKPHTVYWHGRVGVWAVQKRARNRFWQSFGLNRPGSSGKHSILIEVNPPLGGINRRTAGVFLTDGRSVFLGHRGNNINQVRKADFRRLFRPKGKMRWRLVADGSTEHEVVFLGRIDRTGIISAIGRFARQVKRIKKTVRPGMKSPG